MRCEAMVFADGKSEPCGAPATVHMTWPARAGAPARHQHFCVAHARVARVDELMTAARDTGPEADHARATLSHAAIYGLEPLAHPYAPPGLLRAASELRCITCGQPEESPYHTHMIHRRVEAEMAQRQGAYPVVEDPRACLRAVDAARAAAPTGDVARDTAPISPTPTEPTPTERGKSGLERERAAERGYLIALEGLAEACRAALNGNGLTGPVTPALALVDAARAERIAALQAAR